MVIPQGSLAYQIISFHGSHEPYPYNAIRLEMLCQAQKSKLYATMKIS